MKQNTEYINIDMVSAQDIHIKHLKSKDFKLNQKCEVDVLKCM